MVASKAAEEISRYYAAVEQLAQGDQMLTLLEPLLDNADEELQRLLKTLADPARNAEPLLERQQFLEHPARRALQEKMNEQMHLYPVASWFVCDARGTQLASDV